MSPAEVARAAWRVIEPCHHVVYRSPDVERELVTLGVSAREQRYFGGRIAALGEVTQEVAAAVLWGFAPALIAGAIPDVWSIAAASDIAEARLRGASATLASLPIDLEPVASVLQPVAEAIDLPGRPLGACHLGLDWPDDAAGRVWLASTVLREHRGDAHWQATAEAEVDAVECHLLHGLDGHMPLPLLQRVAGWGEREWADGFDRLRSRGLVTNDGLTSAGTATKAWLEHRTDLLAARPWRHTADPESVIALVRPVADAVRRTGLVSTWEQREELWRDLPRPAGKPELLAPINTESDHT